MVGQLLRAAGEFIEVFIDGAEAAVNIGRLIETQLAPSLLRVAAALNNIPPHRRRGDPTADEWLARLDAASRGGTATGARLPRRAHAPPARRGVGRSGSPRRRVAGAAGAASNPCRRGKPHAGRDGRPRDRGSRRQRREPCPPRRFARIETPRRALSRMRRPVTTLGQTCPACRAAARWRPLLAQEHAMSHRVRCRSCRTAFLVDDDRRAVCPKCGAAGGRLVADDRRRRSRRHRRNRLRAGRSRRVGVAAGASRRPRWRC